MSGFEMKILRRGVPKVQWLSKVLTPWVGWGGVGSAEVADRALRLSRPDALMPSTAPGKARCAVDARSSSRPAPVTW